MSFFGTVAGKFVNERRLEIISNNIANALTAGFKASKAVFGMVAEAEDPTGGRVQLKNAYVNLSDTYIDFSDAPIVDSGAPLDFAILGKGFFVVSTPNGEQYTRNGQFTLDREGRLVTMSGDQVMGSGGGITINVTDGKEILVENDGSIFLGNDLIDTIKIVEFENMRALQPVGRGYFNNAGDEAGTTPAVFTVRQGSYEASNVNVMQEMIEMISTMRAYESYTKVDQMFSDANGKLVELGKF